VRIYSGGDSNVTSGAAAALLQNDTAMISVANRVIAVGYITLSLPCAAQKRQNSAGEILGTDSRQSEQSRLELGHLRQPLWRCGGELSEHEILCLTFRIAFWLPRTNAKSYVGRSLHLK